MRKKSLLTLALIAFVVSATAIAYTYNSTATVVAHNPGNINLADDSGGGSR